MRQACLKAAAALLQGVAFENEGQRVVAWIAAANAAERHVYRNIDDSDYEDESGPIPF